MTTRYLEIDFVGRDFIVHPSKLEKKSFAEGEELFRIKPKKDEREGLPHDPIPQVELWFVAPIQCEIISSHSPTSLTNRLTVSSDRDFPEGYKDSIRRSFHEYHTAFQKLKEESEYHVQQFNGEKQLLIPDAIAGIGSFMLSAFILYGALGFVTSDLPDLVGVLVFFISVGIGVFAATKTHVFLNSSGKETEIDRNEAVFADTGQRVSLDESYFREVRVIKRRIFFQDTANRINDELKRAWG